MLGVLSVNEAGGLLVDSEVQPINKIRAITQAKPYKRNCIFCSYSFSVFGLGQSPENNKG
jgi:hypothetical protein